MQRLSQEKIVIGTVFIMKDNSSIKNRHKFQRFFKTFLSFK